MSLFFILGNVLSVFIVWGILFWNLCRMTFAYVRIYFVLTRNKFNVDRCCLSLCVDIVVIVFSVIFLFSVEFCNVLNVCSVILFKYCMFMSVATRYCYWVCGRCRSEIMNVWNVLIFEVDVFCVCYIWSVLYVVLNVFLMFLLLWKYFVVVLVVLLLNLMIFFVIFIVCFVFILNVFIMVKKLFDVFFVVIVMLCCCWLIDVMIFVVIFGVWGELSKYLIWMCYFVFVVSELWGGLCLLLCCCVRWVIRCLSLWRL